MVVQDYSGTKPTTLTYWYFFFSLWLVESTSVRLLAGVNISPFLLLLVLGFYELRFP